MRPTSIYIAIFCVIGFVIALGDLLSHGPLRQWDHRIEDHLPAAVASQRRADHGGAYWFVRVVCELTGGRGFVLTVTAAAVLAVAYTTRRVRTAATFVGAVIAQAVIIEVVKHAVGRSAPHSGIDVLHSGGASFPSGHAANAVLMWGLTAAVLSGTPWSRWFPWRGFWVATTLVGVSTVMLGYHWPLDVVGGWCLGGLMLCLARTMLPDREVESGDSHQVASPLPGSV